MLRAATVLCLVAAATAAVQKPLVNEVGQEEKVKYITTKLRFQTMTVSKNKRAFEKKSICSTFKHKAVP